jgi:hypothetical protein
MWSENGETRVRMWSENGELQVQIRSQRPNVDNDVERLIHPPLGILVLIIINSIRHPIKLKIGNSSRCSTPPQALVVPVYL